MISTYYFLNFFRFEQFGRHITATQNHVVTRKTTEPMFKGNQFIGLLTAAPALSPLSMAHPKALRALLEERYGADSKKLIEELDKIAFGESEFEYLEPMDDDRIPGLMRRVTVRPTYKERIDCLQTLLAYAQGRPRQQLDVNQTHTLAEGTGWDPSKLSLEELERLDAIARKAAIVEGEIVPEPHPTPFAPILPKGKT